MDISNATGGAFMIPYRTENLRTAFTDIVQQAGPRTVVLPFGPYLSGHISLSKSIKTSLTRRAASRTRRRALGQMEQDRITIRGPEKDGSSIVEFKMGDGWARDLHAKGRDCRRRRSARAMPALARAGRIRKRLARRLVAVRRRAAFVLAIRERPQPRRPLQRATCIFMIRPKTRRGCRSRFDIHER
jgi:hypothetical protein